MDPISSTDRLVLLLRQKLQERAKAARAGRQGAPGTTAPRTPVGLEAVAAIAQADDQTLRRAFLQHLLADQMGPELLNDANFQEIVSRVAAAIEQDEAASRLLSRLIADLRST